MVAIRAHPWVSGEGVLGSPVGHTGVVGIVLALLAAATNAAATVLQRKAAGRVPDRKSLSLALIGQLLRYPVWFAGIAAVIAGFLLQAVALSMASLALI